MDTTVEQIFTIENGSLAQPLCKRIALDEIGKTETIPLKKIIENLYHLCDIFIN